MGVYSGGPKEPRSSDPLQEEAFCGGHTWAYSDPRCRYTQRYSQGAALQQRFGLLLPVTCIAYLSSLRVLLGDMCGLLLPLSRAWSVCLSVGHDRECYKNG